MAEIKTKKTKASVTDFLNGIDDRQKRADCKAVARMMRLATGNRARMWGSGIVGFGNYEYEYASGQAGSSMLVGFSPRAQNLTLYIMPGFSRYRKLMKRLGKYKTGKSCLYIKRLEDVDRQVLTELIEGSVRQMKSKYGVS